VMGLVAENLGEVLRQGGLARADDSCNSFEHDRKPMVGKRARSSLGIAFVEEAAGATAGGAEWPWVSP
jgi:hypothetical protein